MFKITHLFYIPITLFFKLPFNTIMTFLLLFLLAWLPACFVAGTLAEDKGHSFFSWAVTAFFFGPIGLLGAVGLSDRAQRRMIGLIAMDQGISREAVRACGSDPDGWKKYLKQTVEE